MSVAEEEPQDETILLVGGPLDGGFETVSMGHPQELILVRCGQRHRYKIDWALNVAHYEGAA